MPKLTLLIDDEQTQTLTLSRIPTESEYIFVDNITLTVERVVHIPNRIGSQALISVRQLESSPALSA